MSSRDVDTVSRNHPVATPAMFITIIGPPSSGKSTIANYLVRKHGFKRVRLDPRSGSASAAPAPARNGNGVLDGLVDKLQIGSSAGNDLGKKEVAGESEGDDELSFASPAELLDHITSNWLSNYVTTSFSPPTSSFSFTSLASSQSHVNGTLHHPSHEESSSSTAKMKGSARSVGISEEDFEGFLKRPFVMVLGVDGPLGKRFERERKR